MLIDAPVSASDKIKNMVCDQGFLIAALFKRIFILAGTSF